LEERVALSTFSWFQNVDGSFNDPSRWHDQNGNNGVPGAGDKAVIGFSGLDITSPTSETVRALNSSSRLTITGGTFTVGDLIDSSSLNELIVGSGALFRVANGTTSITSGSANLGSYSVAPGASLSFTGGTNHLIAGSSLTGGGQYYLTGGTLSVDGNVNAPPDFTLAGGSLAGAGTLTITGTTFNWTGGTMAGTGTTIVAADGTLNLSSSIDRTLDNRTLSTAGAVNFSGAGRLITGNGAVINNSGTWTLAGDEQILYNFGSLPTFNNNGTLTKSAGLATGQIAMAFNNAGTLNVNSGTLQLTNTGIDTGKFNVSASGTLQFLNATSTLQTTATIVGAGLVRLDSGSLVVNTPISVVNFAQSGGTLSGSSILTVTSVMDWTSGNQSGTGSTVIPTGATLNLSGGFDRVLDNRTLNTAGAVNFSGAGRLIAGNGAVINNSGIWTLAGDEQILYNFGSLPTFNNNGTLTKSAGLGAAVIGMAFNNAGTLNVNSGTLQLTGGGIETATFNVATGDTLQFLNGTYTLLAGAAFPGTGTVRLDSGVLAVNGPVTVANFGMGGGTLGGSNILTVTGAMDWTGGTMNGTGTTALGPASTLNLSGSFDRVLDNRTLSTAGAVNFSGAGRLIAGNGAVINNSGIWTLAGDEQILYTFGAPPVFTNTGTFTKASGTGISVIDCVFNNNSIVNLNGGTLQLSQGGLSTGAFNASAGTTLQFTGGTQRLTGSAALPSAGLTQVTNGAALVIDTAVSVQNFGLLKGSLELTGNGALNVGGNYDQTVSGTLLIDIGGTSAFGTLNVTGTANLAGTLVVNLVNDFDPSLGDAYRVLTFGAVNGDFGSKDFPDLGPVRQFISAYNASGLTLSVGSL
jgi:hypothetical protein